MSDNPMIEAPFSSRTVATLVKYQVAGDFHPYTCENSEHRDPLKVSKEGLHCTVRGCGYKQTWVHMFLDEVDE